MEKKEIIFNFLIFFTFVLHVCGQWHTQEFYSGGRGRFNKQIQLRTEDRENGDLGAVAPQSGVLEAAVIWYKKFHFI